MRHLMSAGTITAEGTLQLLKSMLEESGIAYMVRNEDLCVAKGDIPFTECFPELWILDDTDYARAEEIMAQWRQSATEPHESWLCPHCQETNEGQFTACWKCGNELGGDMTSGV